MRPTETHVEFYDLQLFLRPWKLSTEGNNNTTNTIILSSFNIFVIKCYYAWRAGGNLNVYSYIVLLHYVYM